MEFSKKLTRNFFWLCGRFAFQSGALHLDFEEQF